MTDARTAQELADDLRLIFTDEETDLSDGARLVISRAIGFADRLAALASQAEPVATAEVLGKTCIDGGKCHHSCESRCFRRVCCEPFSNYSGPWRYTTPPTPAQAEPTMADALAAGDGTLHGAVDYWQQRALKAEQSEDGKLLDWLDAQNLRFRMGWDVGAAPAGNVSVRVIIMGGKPIRDAIRAAIAAKEQS